MSNRSGTPTSTPAALLAVRLPGPLRPLAGGRDEVAVEGGTVGEALDRLAGRHPGLGRHLRADGGGLREHVNVFLNDDDIRHLRGEATPVAEGDVLTVVASIAGG